MTVLSSDPGTTGGPIDRGARLRAYGILAAVALMLALTAVVPTWFAWLTISALGKAFVVVGVVTLMRTGLVSFGQGLYFCVGGYAVGLTANFIGIREIAVLLPLAVIASVLISIPLGWLLCRYRDIFFAMFSMALSMILYGVLVKSAGLGSTDGFNVPRPSFLGFTPETVETAGLLLYAVAVVLAGIVAFLIDRFYRSELGFAGEGVRENEIRVDYLGVSPRRVLWANYVIAAGLGGLGGGIIALVNGHIDPEMAFWTQSGEFVFIALLGGTGSFAAPFAGAAVFELVRSYALELTPDFWRMILGAVLIAVIVFMPRGLYSLFARKPGS